MSKLVKLDNSRTYRCECGAYAGAGDKTCHDCGEPLIWDPVRADQISHIDNIGQNGNDGLHYDDKDPEVRTLAPKTEAWGSQKDGGHYKTMPIQPMEYTMSNNLNSLQHSIVKYVSRYKDKNGIADLEKAKHCVQMLIDWEK